MPPSILHRLQPDSKYHMKEVMEDIEGAMLFLSKCASTVVETEDLKTKTKWIGEVDIGLMTKIFAVPKTEEGLNLSEQKEKLKGTCAEFIVMKLVELLQLGKPPVHRNGLPLFPDNALLQLCDKKLSDPSFADKAKEAKESESSKDKSAVAEKLEPKVIRLNRKGMPISSHDT